MGILNVTPDSFSDGGRFLTPGAALDQALRMLDEGADIIDVGGESTRPNALPLTTAEEQSRVLPVIDAVLSCSPGAIVSIDTYHAQTAVRAVQAGAEIVNDVSGLIWDPEMASTCAKLRCGIIVMHTRGRPGEWKNQPPLAPAEVVPLVRDGLQHQAEYALQAGIAQEGIVLDPGFGFGKIRGENFPLLAGFAELQLLGFPLLAGLSRKSFLCEPETTGEERARKLQATTAAANATAILGGAHIIRVHDIAEARAAADIADRLLAGTGR
jgi:dihydropteroate synthase